MAKRTLYSLLLCSTPIICKGYVIAPKGTSNLRSAFRPRPRLVGPFHTFSPSNAVQDDVGDGDLVDENDDDEESSIFNEQSQMMGYISDFVRQQRNTTNAEVNATENADDLQQQSSSGDVHDHNTDDYLIAIPLDSCHELGLELESVQRAILYHCPILVHACIPLAATRLPLLYVSIPKSDEKTKKESGNIKNVEATRLPSLTSRNLRTQQLQRVVQETVQRVVFEGRDDHDDNSATAAKDVQRDDGRPDVTGVNEEGVQPIMIPFSTLEIDGVGNQVLFTIGDATSPGGRTLTKLVRELRTQIQSSLGWTTRLPDDPFQMQQSSTQQEQSSLPFKFRPRVPFVRLPPNWNDYLDSSQEFLTSDQGGNGISPILWGQWMDDAFGDAARMREIGIYSKRLVVATDNTCSEESLFHVPDCVIKLPEGNVYLTKVEKQFESYQEQRLKSAEERERKFAQGEESTMQSQTKDNNDDRDSVVEKRSVVDKTLLLDNTPLDKYNSLFSQSLDRLESLYEDDDEEDEESNHGARSNQTDLDEIVAHKLENSLDDEVLMNMTVIANDDATQSANLNTLENDETMMKTRMRQVIDSRARVQTEQQLLMKRKQDKPPIEDNPVFAKYKDGTLVPTSRTTSSSTSRRILPPFPSDEHVVGFWRVVRSPTGFDIEEGDSSRSDNLILRVDGTTAGGPILDSVTRQKASAGTWKLILTKTDDDNDSGTTIAHLRIRLVIPPQKQRILVMQGKLERVRMMSATTATTTDLPLAPRGGTFGIPALEERANRANAAAAASMNEMEVDDDLVYCSGTVHLEDAMTGLNRDDIGTFSIQKLFTPSDPSQYTITIPRPVRNQD